MRVEEEGLGIAVADFRRRGMILEWRAASATWTGLEAPPPQVHGVALIRGVPPNVCLYAIDGRLCLQIGIERFVLDAHEPRLGSRADWLTFGLRRRFSVIPAHGAARVTHTYWRGSDGHFFAWLARRAADAAWRAKAAAEWSQGVEPATVRRG